MRGQFILGPSLAASQQSAFWDLLPVIVSGAGHWPMYTIAYGPARRKEPNYRVVGSRLFCLTEASTGRDCRSMVSGLNYGRTVFSRASVVIDVW